MNRDEMEMRDEAKSRVEKEFPGNAGYSVTRVYDNLMDGHLVTVAFQDNSGKENFGHVHFGRDGTKVYRWHNEVLNAVASYKERVLFFRFLEFAGMGGFIALTLIIIFSVLLFVLVISRTNVDPTIGEIVKHSFSIILGYFFGSQAAGRK